MVKKTGGLPCGRGMTELQCAKCLLPMLVFTEVKCAIHFLTGISFETNEHHKIL